MRRPRLNPSNEGPRVFVASGRDSRDRVCLEVDGAVPEERLAVLRDEAARVFEVAFGQTPESVSG